MSVAGMIAAFWRPALAVALLLAALAGWTSSIGRRRALHTKLIAALAALRQGAFQRIELGKIGGLNASLAQAYNLAVVELQQRLAAQACLAEIDRLLLEAEELERVLEPVLARVRALTRSQVAVMVLVDDDASCHARCFVATDGGEAPVSRIKIDTQLLGQMRGLSGPLTINAQHSEPYGFLEPLRQQGVDSCRIWPIMIGEQVGAMLALGYRTGVILSHEQLGFGSECAARLRFALGNAERDQRLYRQAHFDSLTALPNRLLFRDRLADELKLAREQHQRCALLYIDLDHFKKVNDSLGHTAGDQLLTIIAQRLRACVKEGDTVARLGGDEFTVILRDLPSPDSAGAIAERITDVLERPVNIAGREHHVRASIGITLFPDDADNIESLMRNADLAMYQAKDAGRAQVAFFNSNTRRAQNTLAQSGLYRAVRRQEFALHYQPQFELPSGELVAVEALLRWPSPSHGMRFPKDFIPVAEESGLIVELGAWVLETVCQQLTVWRDEGIAPTRAVLNVSLQQLRLPEFAERVELVLQRRGIVPRTLEMDFNESALSDERACRTLRQLAGLGVRLALDDFGTGYSSLNHLRQHPIDAIKLDGSFMKAVPEDPQATLLTITMIDMAHALGKEVIAEGIETPQQLQFLREHGCDLAQGFLLAPPLGLAELDDLLSSRRSAELLLSRVAG